MANYASLLDPLPPISTLRKRGGTREEIQIFTADYEYIGLTLGILFSFHNAMKSQKIPKMDIYDYY